MTSNETDVRRAYWIALLITGTGASACDAVLDCMQADGCEERDAAHFLSLLTTVAVQRSRAGTPVSEKLAAAALLPVELQRVLWLPLQLRHCFVLRVLLGMSEEEVAYVMSLDRATIAEKTCAAMRLISTPAMFHGAFSRTSQGMQITNRPLKNSI